ncbi:response regulator transcription factor [Bacteriovorax sp. DB6_IX]|uniref:response regulator transcription factor n=1 Tax=Bacteriovorax sp. DB6_IX TaxID=1353530 RepID=UPI000389E4FE|nr:response regulator [Bacteriovorax sp. DB6_IX]EQC51935.1 response regulator receiver domain protein [Bacteriovorax sp. DB6_IX]
MELDDLKENFMLEATELLDEAEDALLAYDNGADFQDSYNKVFRSFHSLKGASGMFGLDELQEHMHKLESLLDKVKDEFPDGSVDYFLAGIDQARRYFTEDKIEFDHVDSFDSKPVTAGKTITQRKEDSIESRDHRGHIFVVDDEQLILDLLSESLIEAGYRVDCFLDGKEVVDIIDDGTPDLIVSDINMPQMDGLTMVQTLKDKGVTTPVVFVSAFVTKDAVLTGLKSGAHYFIEKPFDEKFLLSLVASIFRSLDAKKVINRSIDYVMYQFANHEEVLRNAGMEKEIEVMKNEINTLLRLRQELL